MLLSSSTPTIVLEEIDHQLNEIHCENDLMFLETQSLIFSEARQTFEMYPEILVITSHETCNDRGSRVAYLYASDLKLERDLANLHHRVSLSDALDSSNTLELTAKPISWRHAYSMKVDYGVDHTDYRINAHDHLSRRSAFARRDVAATTLTAGASTLPVSTIPVSTVSTVPAASTVTFPAPTATSTSNQTTVTENIDKSFINAQILPISGSDAANGISLGGASFPSDLALECQNCTFTGSLQLTSGSFNTSNSSSFKRSLDTIEDSVNFLENGYIMVTADNLFAHVDLSTSFPPSFSESLNITLLDIGLTPFMIPGLASVGPELRINLLLSATLSAVANITYGFEVTVPNNSTALASIGSVNQSSVTGFGDTSFNALPFGASVNDIALNLKATLQPEVLVGISFLDGQESAGAGVFLNLPELALAVEQVNGTDENCDPTTNATVIQELGQEYAAMINVVPNVALAAGVIVQAQANVGIGDLSAQRAFTPLATTFTAPTACLGFDRSSSVFVSPTLPPAGGVTGGPGASGTGGSAVQSSSAAGEGGLGRSKAVIDAAVVNAFVVGCLMVVGPLVLW